MKYREICKILGKYLFCFTFILFIPLAVSIYYEYIHPDAGPSSSFAFFETIIVSTVLATALLFFGRKATETLRRKESIFLVVVIWLLSCILAACPFYFSNTLENPFDACFESMSGLTTTGATVMYPKAYNASGKEIPIQCTNFHVPEKTYTYFGTIKPFRDPQTQLIKATGIEAVSRGILFWRCFIQWLGGMGIVVLFLAILPTLSVGGKFLFEMEVPGPVKETLTPKIKDTASILWKLYLVLTIAQVYLLILTNPKMPLFDAFCITFSTLSTGGFSVQNQSIAGYHNPYTDWVVIIFMILGSLNFSIYFQIMRKKWRQIYEPDLLFFLSIIFFGALFVSFYLIGQERVCLDGSKGIYTFAEALRDGTFQAVSAQSSTGFVTIDYDFWPYAPQLALLLLMFVGGMSGSTAGGIKTSRFYILFKITHHKLESLFRPERVHKLKIGDREIDEKTMGIVLTFFFIAIGCAAFGVFLLVMDGIDPETSLGAIACMMNNVGFAFRAAGPAFSFAFFSDFSKVISILWMLLGRLEFFAVLLLCLPSFWKRA
ncbi:MAG: TrkH family potassium uptake protein [Chlamydiota bacterium]